MNRSDEELKTGVRVSRASLAISSASRTLAVIRLVDEERFARGQHRFGLREVNAASLLVRMTASTRRSSSSIESTSSIFQLVPDLRRELLDPRRARFDVGLPPLTRRDDACARDVVGNGGVVQKLRERPRM